uniref:Uncharacterized protein n=1 Tax=Meloidogyne enterolobii TaxID=390850 RepID=A0A6V7Y8X6_MELEN|nr:unnamed protein product [Meloidogyne enterolobii]
MKARLLIAKLGGPEYSKIAQKLLPRKLSDLKYGELLIEIERGVWDPRSKLLKRFDTLKLKCNEFENILQFGNLVNAECEKSEMNLTIEEMKILIFIVGLPDSAMDLKQNCIRMVENKSKKKEDCKFKELLEDCRGFLSTKKRSNYCLNLYRVAIFRVAIFWVSIFRIIRYFGCRYLGWRYFGCRYLGWRYFGCRYLGSFDILGVDI